MVKKITLKGKIRENQKNSGKKSREQGYVPAIVYGGDEEANHSFMIKKQDFVHVFQEAGTSNLIDLTIDDGAVTKVIIKDVQKGPVKEDIIHADFYKVNMKETIDVEIPLNFIGEPKTIKELGGVLLKGMEHVQIKCLPGDLIEHIDVDLSVLQTYDDHIKVSDLKIPENFELISSPDSMVATTVEPKVVVEEVVEVKEEAVAAGDKGDAKAGAKDGAKDAKKDEKSAK